MKKILVLLTLFVLTFTLLTGCGKKSTEDNIITIEMSDEALEYQNTDLPEDGGRYYFTEEYFDLVLQYVDGREEQLLPEFEHENDLKQEEFDMCDVYSLTNDDYDSIVLYIHGGAWVFEISGAHLTFCDELATRLNAKVYIPLYPLAPEADGEETFSAIEELYKELVKEGKKIYVMGDSAGGELTLGLMHYIKEEKLEEPEKLVVMAPCSDMTFTNEDIAEIEENDPALALYGCIECAVMWAGEENLTDPKYSAVYSDVTGYPATMIVQGTNDILCPDNMILYEELKEAGVDVTLVKGEGLWHVFPVYPIPEREEVLDLIEQFCTE